MEKILDFTSLNVIRTISPNDRMFKDNRENHYFSVGASALRIIVFAMTAANKCGFRSILDMPSGHGRVLRYIAARYPHSRITACDIDKDAIDFCEKMFGVNGIYSKKNIADVNINEKFDLIWCGSLLTHLERNYWNQLLEFFSRHLDEDGILIFTTHGRSTVKRLYHRQQTYHLEELQIKDILEQYRGKGFGYVNYKSRSEYGISISSPSWVISEIERHLHFRIMSFIEMGWDNHQDVAICMRSSNGFSPFISFNIHGEVI
ncbi:MAG TPA: class I SAM-dependent methyltransferase [Pyrinomonadaceae bacterium]|jgi:SAM-dependent methyltransferase